MSSQPDNVQYLEEKNVVITSQPGGADGDGGCCETCLALCACCAICATCCGCLPCCAAAAAAAN